MGSRLFARSLPGRFIALLKTESFKHPGKIEHVFQLGIVAHKPVANPSADFNNQARYFDKRIDEPLEFHAQDLQPEMTVGK